MKAFLKKRMKKVRNREKGVALFIALVALLLLAAIAAGMMFMANTESAINYNYRDAQYAYFAASAGLEDAREMMRTDNNYLPLKPPNATNPKGIIYILNPALGENVQPWNPANQFFDDELCQEFPNLVGETVASNTPCTKGAPAGSYTVVNASTIAVNGTQLTGTKAALAYKWVRINLKYNDTLVPSATGTGYLVDGSQPGNSLVCWENQAGHEFIINTQNQSPGGLKPAINPSEFELASLNKAIEIGVGTPAVFMFGGKGKSTSTSGSTSGTGASSTSGTTTSGSTTSGTTTGSTTSTTTSGTTTSGSTTSGTTSGSTTSTTTSGTTTSGTTTSGTTTGSTTSTTTSGTTTGTTTSTTTSGTTTGTTTSTTTSGTTTTSGSTSGNGNGNGSGSTTSGTTTGTTSGTTTGTTSGTTGGGGGYYKLVDDCNATSKFRFSVYLVTSMAFGKNGTKRLAQYEISRMLFPGIPGGLTFNGPGATFQPPSSVNFQIDGNDHAVANVASGGKCPGPEQSVHAVTAFNAGDASTISTAIDGKDSGCAADNTATCSVKGLGYQRTKLDAQGNTVPDPIVPDTIDGTAIDPQTGVSPLDGLKTVKENTDLVAALTSSADLAVKGDIGSLSDLKSRSSGCTKWPMGTNDTSAPLDCQGPKITVIDGNVKMTNPAGVGILVITGDADLGGNLQWDGLILVIGTGKLTLSGGGNKTINGGVYVANTTDPSKLGAVSVDANGGGNSSLLYDSCKIADAAGNQSFRVITYREMTY